MASRCSGGPRAIAEMEVADRPQDRRFLGWRVAQSPGSRYRRRARDAVGDDAFLGRAAETIDAPPSRTVISRPFACSFGSGRLAERVHWNLVVLDIYDLELLGLLRCAQDDEVAQNRFHQRASERRHPADVAAVQVDLVDADDADDVVLAGGVAIRHGRAEEHPRGRRAGPSCGGIDDFGRVDALPEEADPRIDLAQPPLAIEV